VLLLTNWCPHRVLSERAWQSKGIAVERPADRTYTGVYSTPTAILSVIAKQNRAKMTNVASYCQKDNSVTTFILRCINPEKQPSLDDYHSFGSST